MPVNLSYGRFVQLNGLTRVNRIEMTARLRDAIDTSGGWITDFHQFSNLSVCLNFEIRIERLPQLGEALQASGLRLAAGTEALLLNSAPEQATGEVRCTLQVTFVHDEPDLRLPVLAVPG
jgi:hypothetical protein